MTALFVGVQLDPDVAGVAAVVSEGHGASDLDAIRLASALGYLRARLAGLDELGDALVIDVADAALKAGQPIAAGSVIGQYRRESAAILTGRHSPPPGWPS